MSTTDLSKLTPEEKRALVERLLAEKKSRPARSFPLSFAQQRLWFIDRLQPTSGVYSIPLAVRLTGDLDAARLGRCLDALVARHESLRTRFVAREGAPFQVIDAPGSVALVRETLPSGMPTLEGRLQALVEEPFDLEKGPLIRCRLYAMGAREHILAVVVHHIVADYWSLQVLIGELARLYGMAGEPDAAALPPLPIQYPDYAVWQQGRAGEVKAQLDYWRAQLADAPELLPLPADFPRPALPSFDGARHAFQLSPELSAAVARIARERGMTPFMVLLAAFQLLLHRYSGADDILVGSTVSNRDRAELQGVIGLFVNNLVFRARLDAPQSFDALLTRTRATALAAFANQEVPFEQVVDALDIERSLSHNALFQAMFVLHNTESRAVTMPGLALSPVAFSNRSARFDLALDMYEGETYSGVFEYATDLFRPATIARLTGHFLRLLDAVTADPARPLGGIDLLGHQEREALERRNRTAAPIPAADVATLIEARAAERGEAIALCFEDRALSYAAMNARANRLAAHIRRRLGAVEDQPRIAIGLPRREALPIALLAVLKLGAAYVPLDPAHPPSRLRGALEDSGAGLLLTLGGLDLEGEAPCPVLDLAVSADAIAAEPDTNPDRDVRADDLAYVIFTSGSTGRPKGVPVRQDSLVNLLTSMAGLPTGMLGSPVADDERRQASLLVADDKHPLRTPGMTASDTFVAVTTPAFDIATLELLMPLLVGGRLVVAEPHTVYDDAALSRLLATSGATIMQATPATWRLLAEGGWRAPAGFKMLCGGEALDPALARRLLEGGGELWNLYGPTETTIWSAAARIRPEHVGAGVIPLGEPIANTQLHVLDRDLQPVPTGVVGQLHIGGAGLSPGYWRRDDLTEAAFVANPFFAGDPAAHSPRLYRTGDAVRRLEDGRLVYLGRLDFQVKLRGFRIELGDIEAALQAEPDVRHAVVALRQDGEGEGELVAYCQAAPDARAGLETRLRGALAARLPGYMIPSSFVFLDAFPLNASGKVDRKRLPRAERAERANGFAPPRTATEQLVADLWAEILGLPRVSREDRFFDLGGHSLLAARMVARLRSIFDATPPLRMLFETPRLKDFCAAIDAMVSAAAERPASGIPVLARGGGLPLSFAQQRLWTLAQLEPDSPFYNIPVAVRLTGEPDITRLARAFMLLCERHEVLRSRFVAEDGRAAVEIMPRIDLPLPVSPVPLEGLEAAVLAEARRPFDLAEAPLLRARLFADAPGAHVLVLVLHHILADALSMSVLIRDLAWIYRSLGRADMPALPPLAVQYADFAAWQRGQDTVAQLAYWRGALAGAPLLLELPTDFPRPASQGFDGDSVRFRVAPGLAEAIRAAANASGATPFMAVLAAFATLLARYSGMDDIVIGTPVAQRPHAALEGLIGLFVNTLALRVPCPASDSFADRLARTRTIALEGFANQDVPFEQVVDALELPRGWSHTPLFQAMFVWNTQEREAIPRPEGLDWEPLLLEGRTAKTDIALLAHDGPDGLTMKLEYRTDLFRRETIVAMAEAFTTLLRAVAAEPDRPLAALSMLPANQRRRIAAWNATERDWPATPATLHGLVDARIAASPEATAITSREGSITYRALGERADALARRLAAMGIGRGQRVGIRMPRGIDLVCAILAVLRTGAAYVPLDPRYPKERIAFIAEDADMALLLTRGEEASDTAAPRLDLGGFWDAPPDAALPPLPRDTAEGADLAYIIYTSGSTGQPKGVALEHGNGVAFVRWCLETFSRGQLAGVLGATSVCFDLSIFEIFATLAGGGRLLMVEDLFDLHGAPFAGEVTLINTVPTAIAELLRLGALPPSVGTVTLAGEVLPASTAAAIHAAGSVTALWCLWGPTEDTTFSSGEIVPPAFASFGIGGPIAGTQAYVLDDRLQQTPVGMPGEIYLAGAGLARGYWRRPDLTAERFLPNPFATSPANTVMYRTGDRGRWLHDGRLDFLGRVDRQLKIRGFRVEPGEVESALRQHPDVAEAVVDAWRDASGNARLAAWIEGSPPPDAADVTRHLRQRLPEHLVPTLIVGLDKLPRLPNGKLDRKSLPDPTDGSGGGAAARLPGDGLEARIAAIWRPLLGRAEIGREDNFFALGGDSILAIQVVAKARQAGIMLLPRDIFQHPTLADLASAVADRAPPAGHRGPVTGDVPLTPIQRWLLERELPRPRHWNQGLMLKSTRRLDADRLEAALAALAAQHDTLRARFTRGAEGWRQYILPVGDAPRLRRVACSGADPAAGIAEAAAELHAGFDATDGPLWGAVLIDLGEGGQRLAIAAHHLLVDGVSWRTLLTDLQAHYLALEAGGQPLDPARASAVGDWIARLARSDIFDAEASLWNGILAADAPPLPLDNPKGGNLVDTAATLTESLDTETTRRLLHDAPASYPVQANDLLLTALLLAVRDWSGQHRLRIELESHGRPDLFDDIDLSRTVGWLTALYPVLLEAAAGADAGAVLLGVKTALRKIPHDGVGYGVLRHLRGRALAANVGPAQVRFNYLGQIDNLFSADALFVPSGDPAGPMQGAANPRDTILDVNAWVSGGRLHAQWTYGAELHRRATIETLAERFNAHLAALAEHCLTAQTTGYTPADFALMDFDQGELDDLLRSL